MLTKGVIKLRDKTYELGGVITKNDNIIDGEGYIARKSGDYIIIEEVIKDKLGERSILKVSIADMGTDYMYEEE